MIFKHNTVVGDLPSLAFAMRLNVEGSNLPDTDIQFYNNIWSDPNGTLGAENPTRPNDFSDTPPGETQVFILANNLYWNGGSAIPSDNAELINYDDDAAASVANPQLGMQSGIILPRWSSALSTFADGSTTIRQAFVRLVLTYGAISPESPAIDAANSATHATEDILGRIRTFGDGADIGAYEFPGVDNPMYLPLMLKP